MPRVRRPNRRPWLLPPRGGALPRAATRTSQPAVLDLGAVTEAEKDWLFERCDLVVYPSVLEGFGLVPFEAAAHRVPCLWAPGSSLSELLPDEAAGIVPGTTSQSAAHARALIQDQTGPRGAT